MNSPLQIREIEPGESLRPFIDLSWTMNAGDPAWVPPLRRQLRTMLDRSKHPFHRHADVAYFLAERGGKPVGRIGAIVNHRHNEFHQDRVGFFGFFECEDQQETASALFRRAEEWLAARGMEWMRGPMNFSTNEECGLLVEGFADQPTVMMPHNPPYYAALIEDAGLEKETDLLAYALSETEPPERLVRLGERTARKAGVRVRSLDMRRFREEVEAVQRVYNSAWSRNWGFVPMTEEEFDHMAGEMKPVVDPDLCLIVETDAGEPIGFTLALPDVNQALKSLNGRLFPFGILRFLWKRRKIDRIRVLTLGFTPEYTHAGLGPFLYLRTWHVGTAKGYRFGEASWILENNREMRGALERMGAEVSRVYRIYGRSLGEAA
jgi:hypothetical protein